MTRKSSPGRASDKPTLKFYGAQPSISPFPFSILGEGKHQELNQVNTGPRRGKDPNLNQLRSGTGTSKDPKRSVAAIDSEKETLDDNNADTCFQVGGLSFLILNYVIKAWV